ncbi:hypothetical protein PRVXT_000216 [Proteinivorax tanatarense]|uniref:Uncharacterized protein n=1 Tax=Proteinivorax tanatarense TaxID=1260629 RepID=A0AAU7VM34_9FIRM
MTKKILATMLLLLAFLSGSVYAEDYTIFWPDGWSYYQNIGNYHRSFSHVNYVQNDELLYFLSRSSKDGEDIELTLKEYNLEEQQVTSTGPTVNTKQKEVTELFLDKSGDTFFVSWVYNDNDIYYSTIKNGEVTEPKLIYAGERAVYSKHSFNFQGNQYFLWRQVHQGSANILGGYLDENGELNILDDVFLGNDRTNYVKDVYVTHDDVKILWISDETLDGFGRITLYYSEYDGEEVETRKLEEYTGRNSGTPKFFKVDDKLKVGWRQTVNLGAGIESLVVRGVEEQDQSQTAFKGPSFTNFDIVGSGSNTISLALEVALGYEREIFVADFDLSTKDQGDEDQGVNEQDIQRLTYDSSNFWHPNIVQHEEHHTIFFVGSQRQDLEIFAINNKYPDEPSLWRKLGLNENEPMLSGLYFGFKNFIFAGIYTIASLVPLGAVSAMILILRKYGLFRKQGRRNIVLQMLFGFALLAIFREARWFYFFERLNLFFDVSYTLYSFAIASILSLLALHLSSMWKEDTGIPLSLALFLFIDQLLIALPTIVWYQ